MTDPSASVLADIFGEMSRQAVDARESFLENAVVAERIARSARESGRLLLLGMGGSHAVNRVAEVLYRSAGIDATSQPVSEALLSPPAAKKATVLLTSQSGDSGEVVAYLARPNPAETRFGLTLDPKGALARSVPSLLGHGGAEKAFAATRSLYISLALHARVLHALGIAHDRIVDEATRSEAAPVDAAVARFTDVHAAFFTGRAAMQGIAEAAALGLIELARMPAAALEGGQFRHGPLEALGPRIGVVFVRPQSTDPDSTPELIRIAVESGSPTIVFDLSGDSPVVGAEALSFKACAGIEAALTVLPTLQRFIFEAARRRVSDVGQPIRSSKVTRGT